MFISLLLDATSILCCNQFPSSNLYSRSRPQGDVATSCCYFSCRIYSQLLKISCDLDFFLLSSSSGRDLNEWSRHRLWSLVNKWSQLQFLCKDFVLLRFRLRPPLCSSNLNLVATSIFLSRLQSRFHVATATTCRDLKWSPLIKN